MCDIVSVIVGFVLGAFVSFGFYALGHADAEIATWRSLMFSAIFRLKQMTPTSRERVVGGFGLAETENFLTCLAETVRLSGWPDGAAALTTVVREMAELVHCERPTDPEAAERERKKKEWESHLHAQIQDLSRLPSRLRLALPSRAATFIDAQVW